MTGPENLPLMLVYFHYTQIGCLEPGVVQGQENLKTLCEIDQC